MQRFDHIVCKTFTELGEYQRDGYELVMQTVDGLFLMKRPILAVQQWEYCVSALNPFITKLEDHLTDLGKEGWELISSHQLGNTDLISYYFKRHKTEPGTDTGK